jgi:hypothetical protein
VERFRSRVIFLALAVVAGTVSAAEPSAASQALSSGWDAVKGFGELALKAVWHFSLWGMLGLVLGATAAVFLWRALRDRGWMDVPWRGYKYVRWLWPVLMVGTLSLGLGSGLGVWGGGRAIKQGAREGVVFETAVVKTYAAIMVWRLGGADANGTSLLERDLAEAISKLRKTTGQAQAAESATRERAMEALDKQSGGNDFQKWVGRQVIKFLWDEQLKGKFTETEAAEFLGSLRADRVSSTEAVALAKKKIMSGVYLALDETVNSIVYPTLATILFTVLAVLLGPLGTFRLVRWLCLRRQSPPDSPDDIGKPPLLKDAE